MCYLGIDKAIEDPSVCLRALPAVLVAPISYPFALGSWDCRRGGKELSGSVVGHTEVIQKRGSGKWKRRVRLGWIVGIPDKGPGTTPIRRPFYE